MHATRSTLCLAYLIAAALPLAAQTFGEITGTLVDSSGAVVAGALVKATNNATSQVRQVETNEAGSYTIPFLAPGHYQVRAEKAGFKTATRTDVLLQVADSVRVNFTIEVGNVSESVEVRAEASNVTNTPNFGNPVSSITSGDFMRILTLNGSYAERQIRLAVRYSF